MNQRSMTNRKTTLQFLLRELNREVNRRGGSFPPAKYIRSKLIAAWSKMKGGIDTYSAILAIVRLNSLSCIQCQSFLCEV